MVIFMVSNDEIQQGLKNRREGVNSDKLSCPKCGTKNTLDSTYCMECGSSLKLAEEREKIAREYLKALLVR